MKKINPAIDSLQGKASDATWDPGKASSSHHTARSHALLSGELWRNGLWLSDLMYIKTDRKSQHGWSCKRRNLCIQYACLDLLSVEKDHFVHGLGTRPCNTDCTRIRGSRIKQSWRRTQTKDALSMSSLGGCWKTSLSSSPGNMTEDGFAMANQIHDNHKGADVDPTHQQDGKQSIWKAKEAL